jgi:hypothetical protein
MSEIFLSKTGLKTAEPEKEKAQNDLTYYDENFFFIFLINGNKHNFW